jgi:hypothetical protein
MAFDRNFGSKVMTDRERASSPQKFSVPREIDEILELLPQHVTLNVPDHILSLWFPPGPATVSWRDPRSSVLKAMRKAADASSHITAVSVKESSISCRRKTERIFAHRYALWSYGPIRAHSADIDQCGAITARMRRGFKTPEDSSGNRRLL